MARYRNALSLSSVLFSSTHPTALRLSTPRSVMVYVKETCFSETEIHTLLKNFNYLVHHSTVAVQDVRLQCAAHGLQLRRLVRRRHVVISCWITNKKRIVAIWVRHRTRNCFALLMFTNKSEWEETCTLNDVCRETALGQRSLEHFVDQDLSERSFYH